MNPSQNLPTATQDEHANLVIENLTEIAAAGGPDMGFCVCIVNHVAREFQPATTA
jgi:hypothetical protein